jgi:hypothetical protein
MVIVHTFALQQELMPSSERRAAPLDYAFHAELEPG